MSERVCVCVVVVCSPPAASQIHLVCHVQGRHDEALAIAERGRTRAFADLLVERQKGSQQAASADPYIPVTVEHILETVNGQKAMVLYYSLAGGFLYSWLLSPGTGTHTPGHITQSGRK